MSRPRQNRSKQPKKNLPARKATPPASTQDSPAVAEAKLQEQLEVSVESIRWQGPIPPPAVIREYEDVLPGAAERILRMAEVPMEMAHEQQHHRHDLESRVVRSDMRRSWAGMILGFLLALAVVSAGVWLVWNDRPVEGIVAILGPVATLAGVFVFSQRSRTREIEQKRPERRSNKSNQRRRRK